MAEIIPEIKNKLSDLEPPPALEPEQARFRLFDSVTTFLKNVAQSQPLMLVLDDLHWADRSSLSLLQFLAREISGSRLILVGAYRDAELSRQHPLSETLAQLSREPAFRREPLRGLSQEETEQFIAASAGIEPTTGMVEALYSHTEGNPFFMTEVIRLLSENGELTGDYISTLEGLRIPEGVREVIGQRLNRLSEQCNEVLTTASIIGREFDFRLLNILSGGLSEDRLLQAVDEAVSFHLIEDMPGQRDRYQFSHALIQQTLAEEVTTSRTVRLHARIGEALEQLYDADVGAHAAELAHHFSQAQPVLGPDKLVHYSQVAGEQALAAYAYEEGLFHYRRALDAKGIPSESSDPAPDGESAALLFGFGRAQVAALTRNQMPLAVANLTRAFDYYAKTGDIAQAIAIAEFPVVSFPGFPTGMAQLIGRALELTVPNTKQAGLLLSRYGIVMGQEQSDYGAAQDAFARALEIAESHGDSALEMRTLANASSVDIFHLHWDETKEKALSAIALGRGVLDTQADVIAHYSAFNGMHHLGEHEQARRYAVAMLPLAEQLRDRYWLATAFSRNAVASHNDGDWQSARDFSDRGLAVSPLDPRLLGNRVLIEYELGNFAEGQVYLERIIETMRMTAPGPATIYGITAAVIPIVAQITGVAESFDTAETAANTVLRSPIAPPSFAMWSRIGLGLVAVHREDAMEAEEQYAALELVRGTVWMFNLVHERALGLLSTTMGQLDRAVAHFEDSLAFCRRGGSRPEYAWTCRDYADTLLKRNGTGDSLQAKALLDESLSISRELGMIPLTENATALEERLESQPAEAPAYPDSLTHREVEVLHLVAAGRSNPEISEELFISVNTVARHLTNIFTKTGAANRAEAASYATRRGLV
ncbi:MAG: LuxR C-terminal-related transcriptional regulator [Dehalococcoidia bacterium]